MLKWLGLSACVVAVAALVAASWWEITFYGNGWCASLTGGSLWVFRGGMSAQRSGDGGQS